MTGFWQWFEMGGYGVYVWTTYGVASLVLIGLALYVNGAKRLLTQMLTLKLRGQDASSS